MMKSIEESGMIQLSESDNRIDVPFVISFETCKRGVYSGGVAFAVDYSSALSVFYNACIHVINRSGEAAEFGILRFMLKQALSSKPDTSQLGKTLVHTLDAYIKSQHDRRLRLTKIVGDDGNSLPQFQFGRYGCARMLQTSSLNIGYHDTTDRQQVTEEMIKELTEWKHMP